MTNPKRTTRKKPQSKAQPDAISVDVSTSPEPTIPPEEDGDWRILLRFGTSSMILFRNVSKPFASVIYKMLTAAMMDGIAFEYVGRDTGLNLIDGRKIAAVHMTYVEPPRKRARPDDPCCGEPKDCGSCDYAADDVGDYSTDKE